jgi:lipopolysaccharide transport system permease protein
MVGSALFHTLVSLLILVTANLLMFGRLSWTVSLLPVVLLPFLLFLMGLVWFLAGLGVYLRDIRQVMGVLTTMLMFLAPVFYPISALPPAVQPWVWLNPLTAVIEAVRAVVLHGQMPAWLPLGAYALVALVVFLVGFTWFQKTRRGFGDVL